MNKDIESIFKEHDKEISKIQERCKEVIQNFFTPENKKQINKHIERWIKQ